MSWLSIATQLASFVTGPFGLMIITIAVAAAGGHAALMGHWHKFFAAVAGGGVLVSAAWFVNTFLAG